MGIISDGHWPDYVRVIMMVADVLLSGYNQPLCWLARDYSRPRSPVMHHTYITWWRHQMETFSALLAICAGNSPVTGEFPTQRPVTRSFDVFFDLCLNKRLSKQWRCWWYETQSRPLWRHCNEYVEFAVRSVTPCLLLLVASSWNDHALDW